MPQPLRDKAMKLIARTVAESKGAFQRVFWAENTGYVNAMELFEIQLDAD